VSDFSERVYSLLTDEWQSSRQIAERVGDPRDVKAMTYKVRRVLLTYVGYGMVEVSETVGDGCNRRFYWRRRSP